MKTFSLKNFNKFVSIMLSLFLIFSFSGIGTGIGSVAAQSTIIYVQQGGSSNGTSWENAFGTLQEALDTAQAGQQIWVAKGVYYPTKNPAGNENPTDPRTVTFQMKNGVAIYGGFAGDEGAEFNLGARDFWVNETVLSGNFNKTESTNDNSYQVIRNVDVNLDRTAVLDGFTISEGQADFSLAEERVGAGMYNDNSNPTLSNLIFTDNLANRQGGGMYNKNSSPLLMNVTFQSNRSFISGGGMHNENSSPKLTNVIFDANGANQSGGGMYNIDSNPDLENVTFKDNKTFNSTTREGGAGMFNRNSNPVLIDVDFTSNEARHFAGGMYNDNSSPTLENVTFDGNITIDREGGGMRNMNNSNPILKNVLFINNRAMNGSGGAMQNQNSSPVLTRVTFSGNETSGLGGGISNWDSSPILTDVVFNGNEARNGGGMHSFSDSSPVLTNVKFLENIARDTGGGMVSSDGTSPVLTNVIFQENIAGDFGGAMFNSRGNSPILTNVVFTGNIGRDKGSAIYNTNASPIFNNVTFSGHSIDYDSGVMYNRFGSNPVITNSIFSASENRFSNDEYDEIFNEPSDTNPSNPVISYSIIANSGGSGANWNTALGTDGGNNLDADPLFISESNLRLEVSSPAIDAGSNAPFLSGGTGEGITTDLDGNQRIVNDIVDMGAYEYQGEGQPALENITDILREREDLSILLAALEATGLDGALEGDGPFTLFAPKDEAFLNLLGVLGIDAEALLSSDDLEDILLYHVVGEKLMAEQLEDGMEIETLSGETLRITVSSIFVNESLVIEADIEAINGVIHIIDAVLLLEEDDDDDDDDDDSVPVAKSVMWKPPISLNKSVNNGSTLPIKFVLADSEGQVLREVENVTLIIEDSNGERVLQWSVDQGLEFKYDQEGFGFYQGNFHTREFNLESGEFTVSVLNDDNIVIGSILTNVTSPQRGRPAIKVVAPQNQSNAEGIAGPKALEKTAEAVVEAKVISEVDIENIDRVVEETEKKVEEIKEQESLTSSSEESMDETRGLVLGMEMKASGKKLKTSK